MRVRLDKHTDYQSKDPHGLHWGLNRFVGTGHKLKIVEKGGNLERIAGQRFESIKPGDRLLQFGNPWIAKDPEERIFNHYEKLLPIVDKYYFWDNPQIPHFLYKDVWNPRGHKLWIRLVPDNIMSKACDFVPDRELQINEMLQWYTGNKRYTWRNMLPRRRDVKARGKRVLLLSSSTGVYHYYSNLDREQWLQDQAQKLTGLGYEVEIRRKMGRTQRILYQPRLDQYLYDNDFAFTLSYQSASMMESLIAGTPAVTYNHRHCGGKLATTYEEMLDGHIRESTQEDVDQRILQLFSDTFHKHEAFDGSWYRGQ